MSQSLRHRHAEHDSHRHLEEGIADPKVHDSVAATATAASTPRSQPRPSRKRRQQQTDSFATYVRYFLIIVAVITVLGGTVMAYYLIVEPRLIQPPTAALSPDFQVSVVLMNHWRPRMIRKSALLPTLLDHPHVAEVLLAHSNRNTTFHYEHPKVRNLDAVQANTDRGLSLRFYFCYTAANHDHVIIVDDDQEVTTAALDALLETLAASSDRIVGRYGRAFRPYWARSHHGYSTRTVFGPVEVVLTKLLVAPRSYCGNFLRYESLVSDLLNQSHPLWNGEDIFFSLVANHVQQVPIDGPFRNVAVAVPGVSEAPNRLKDDDAGWHDVSGNMDRHVWYKSVWSTDAWEQYGSAVHRAQEHTAYRGTLWGTAKARLAQLTTADEERMAEKFAHNYGNEFPPKKKRSVTTDL